MTSRYIPSDVDKAVKERHFFECAWCGEKLLERHHIVEFSKGGEHSEENLILLCPNCHTQTHKGEINIDELKLRKSTHTIGDRLSGGVQFNLTRPIINLGNSHFENVPTLLQLKSEPLITLLEINGKFQLSTRFYNASGELVFWMSSNKYWTNSDFVITSKKDELTIINNALENNRLRIWQDKGSLNLEGTNHINGTILKFTPTIIQIGNSTISSISVKDCQIGILIS